MVTLAFSKKRAHVHVNQYDAPAPPPHGEMGGWRVLTGTERLLSLAVLVIVYNIETKKNSFTENMHMCCKIKGKKPGETSASLGKTHKVH